MTKNRKHLEKKICTAQVGIGTSNQASVQAGIDIFETFFFVFLFLKK